MDSKQSLKLSSKATESEMNVELNLDAVEIERVAQLSSKQSVKLTSIGDLISIQVELMGPETYENNSSFMYDILAL